MSEQKRHMGFEDLSLEEQSTIYECVKAAVNGPFFPDWEFHSLFGLSRKEMAEIVKLWSSINLDSQDAQLAINGALNNLTGYPHPYFEVWQDYLPSDRHAVIALFEKWRATCRTI